MSADDDTKQRLALLQKLFPGQGATMAGPSLSFLPATTFDMSPKGESDLGDSLAAWSEHLHYDASMLHDVFDLLRMETELIARLPLYLQVALHNSLVESFQVHERNLAEFFRRPKENPDDRHFYLSNYLKQAQIEHWRTQNGDEIEHRLEEIFTTASEHLSHPSKTRTHAWSRRLITIEKDIALFDTLMTKLVNQKKVKRKLSQRRDWSRWQES